MLLIVKKEAKMCGHELQESMRFTEEVRVSVPHTLIQQKPPSDVASCQHGGQQCAGLLKLQSMPSGLGSAHSSPSVCTPFYEGKQSNRPACVACPVCAWGLQSWQAAPGSLQAAPG